MNQSTWLTNQSFAGDIQSLSQYWHLNFNYLTFTVGFIPSEPCTTHTGEWSNRISAHSLWHTCPFKGTLIDICRGNTWKAEMYCAIKPILGNISTSRCGDFLLTNKHRYFHANCSHNCCSLSCYAQDSALMTDNAQWFLRINQYVSLTLTSTVGATARKAFFASAWIWSHCVSTDCIHITRITFRTLINI